MGDGVTHAMEGYESSPPPLAVTVKPGELGGGNTHYDLSFDQLRAANEARRHKIHQQKGKWSLSDWMTALCGEVGEAANIIKKVRRQDFTLDEARVDLAKEFGDVVCYLDLLASECGINLGSAVADKFNEVSRRHNHTTFIQPDGNWTDTRGGEHDNPIDYTRLYLCQASDAVDLLVDEDADPASEASVLIGRIREDLKSLELELLG